MVTTTASVAPDSAEFFSMTTPPTDNSRPTRISSTRQPPGRPSSTIAVTIRTTPETTKYAPNAIAAILSVAPGQINSAKPSTMAITPMMPYAPRIAFFARCASHDSISLKGLTGFHSPLESFGLGWPGPYG